MEETREITTILLWSLVGLGIVLNIIMMVPDPESLDRDDKDEGDDYE
jgi:hypothetical protein